MSVILWFLCLTIALSGAMNYEQQEKLLKTCYHDTEDECPRHAHCILLHSNKLKCICLFSFELNPQWQDLVLNSTADNENSSEIEDANYCIPSSANDTEVPKVVVFIQAATNPKHLLYVTILIFLGVCFVLALIYIIKAMSPLKHSKAVYQKLRRNNRQNIPPLQELDELELNRRYEMETF